jgi:hypothetical protein
MVAVPSAEPAPSAEPVPSTRAGRTRRVRRVRRVRAGALIVLLVACVLGMGGCTRVRTALAVQSDDTVAGDVVIGRAGGPAPAIDVPAELADRVTATPYDQDGYQGTALRFTDLTFAQLNSLTEVSPDAKGRFRFTLRRAGGLIVLGGQVDLTAMPVDQADVQLKVAFPGDVVSSDGQLVGHEVSWVFPPGEVDQFNAVVSSPDPGAPSVTRWLLLVGAVVVATAAGVVLLARAQRNPPSRLATVREQDARDRPDARDQPAGRDQ